MKLLPKCLTVLLTALLLLTACAAKDGAADATADTTTTATAEGGENTAPDIADDRSLEEIYNDFISKVSAELPSMVQNSVSDDMFSYYFGVDKPAGTKEAFVSEPMVGAMPFSITLLRVEGDADLAALASDIKSSVDPRRWICVEASFVETAVRGDVILLVLDGDNARGQEIIDAFKNL